MQGPSRAGAVCIPNPTVSIFPEWLKPGITNHFDITAWEIQSRFNIIYLGDKNEKAISLNQRCGDGRCFGIFGNSARGYAALASVFAAASRNSGECSSAWIEKIEAESGGRIAVRSPQQMHFVEYNSCA